LLIAGTMGVSEPARCPTSATTERGVLDHAQQTPRPNRPVRLGALPGHDDIWWQHRFWAQIGDLQLADAERLIGQAIDAGINFIDTADIYAGGACEQITGQALKNLKVPREHVVIATKVFGETGPGANTRGNSRGHILDGVKASLKRLQVEHIDLYQIHGFDPATPITMTFRKAHFASGHDLKRFAESLGLDIQQGEVEQ